MNEISTTIFLFLTGMCLLFLIGSLFLEDKNYALISSILSATGFITLAQMILNGNVGVFYVTGTTLSFHPVQSTTIHYFYYAIGVISAFLTVYIIYEIIIAYFAAKNKSAFDMEA